MKTNITKREIMEQFTLTLQEIIYNAPLFLIAIIIVWAGKLLYDITTPFSFNHELTENDNEAFGFALSGYLIGLAIALMGCFSGTDTENYIDKVITLAFGGVVSIVLMRASVFINDKFILGKFDINKEMVTDRNSGTGAVVGGSCIATGLMISGVLSGESESLIAAITDVCIYWAVGQLILVTGGKFYTLTAGYDVHKIIEEDNIPAGISLSGFLIAIGIITHASLKGASGPIGNELIIIGTSSVISIILLATSSVLADKIFLPKSKLVKEIVEDRNIASGSIAFSIYICISIAIAAVLSSSI